MGINKFQHLLMRLFLIPDLFAFSFCKQDILLVLRHTEVNEAVDEMIDSLFVVLDRINNAQAFLASMHNLVNGMLSLLEEEYDLPQLTEE